MSLERPQDDLGDSVQLELVWKSFLLRPYPEPKPIERFRRYTESWMRPAGQAAAGEFRVWSTDEDPPSRENILIVVREYDFDLVRFVRDFDDRSVAQAVIADHNEAVEMGISAVPFVVVDGGFQMSGAQQRAVNKNIVQRLIATQENL